MERHLVEWLRQTKSLYENEMGSWVHTVTIVSLWEKSNLYETTVRRTPEEFVLLQLMFECLPRAKSALHKVLTRIT
jgi:hypothetical protein